MTFWLCLHFWPGTAACDNIIMHYAKKYLLSPPNLTPDNFSGCPVVFVWCHAVDNHYLVTSSAPCIVCSLARLSFPNLKTPYLFDILLYKTVCCFRASSLPSFLLFNFHPPWGKRTRLHAKAYPARTGFCQNVNRLYFYLFLDRSVKITCFESQSGRGGSDVPYICTHISIVRMTGHEGISCKRKEIWV